VISNQPAFVGSMTSGVDGGSEGGRLSTSRLPSVLALYGASLLRYLKQCAYKRTLTVEPAQVDGIWVIKVTYDGEPPTDVPGVWQGHLVLVEPAQRGQNDN
jgi:hypothetical protein